MRSIRCALIILSLWIPQASAQTAVLIGVHQAAWEDAQPPSYRTFLITFRDGKAQLAADIPDLIVPRKDGFWRVGSVHKGPPTGGDQEFIYAAPLRSVPHAVGEYHPENPESNCPQTNEATIEFVNPELLSVSSLDQAGCSLEVQYGHSTYKLDELEKGVEINTILGPAAWVAEKKADALAKAEAHADRPECVGVSKPDSWNWGIERSSRLPQSKSKPWTLVSDYYSPHVCGDGDRYEINFQIPESVTGLIYHASSLSSLLKSKVATESQIPPNESWLTPAGDFLVAVGEFTYSERVRVYRISQQGIEAKSILSVSTSASPSWGFNVVMVQWALGKYVAQWESELKSRAATPLPEPTVALGNPQP
jgi:hypothetical protein